MTEKEKVPGAVAKVLIIAVLVILVGAAVIAKNSSEGVVSLPADSTSKVLPKLVDLGAGKCIPCKMMAPILEELKDEYKGKFDVVFIDVWEDKAAGDPYGIRVIPTQIFFDAKGKELFRHEGFFSKEDILAKWKEFGIDFAKPAPTAVAEPTFSRLEPVAKDDRPRESICYMCDGDVTARTRVLLKTAKGDVTFCSPHCYFIMCSSMVPPKNTHDDASVTDWASGTLIPADSASYILGMDATNRPVIKAFADLSAATAEQKTNGGNVVNIASLQEQEMAARCGFCDRVVYPVDACAVKVGGLNTWGCCTMCALGVAARLQKDIEMTAKDGLSGKPIHVKTAGGHVISLVPEMAVAWAGAKKDVDGKIVSTGCFKQAFFANEGNLRKWVDGHPTATGSMISIEQALAAKMKLTSQQISKACKIGECEPK